MAGRRVLIVGQNAVLQRSLREQILAQDDYRDVDTAETQAEATDMAVQQRYDAMIVMDTIPDGSPQEFIVNLRSQEIMWPALMLQNDASLDVPSAFGVVDILQKPFRMAAIFTRLRGLIRAFENSDDAVLTIGPYTFQPASKHLCRDVDGEVIRLTEKEASILKFLYRAGDDVVPRDVLLHEVWGYNPAVTTHTLETHVYRLRQKIEDNPSEAQILVTDSGGYRLVP